jgi:hypothetical protein
MNLMKRNAINYLLPGVLALFFLYGCIKDEAIEAACIVSPPTEGFAGETITLQSCNQNMTEYSWSVSGTGDAYGNLKGQTVDFTLPTDPGQYTFTLFIKNSKGITNKSFNISVKASGGLISEGTNTSMENLEGFQQPNGNFTVFGTFSQPGKTLIQYKWILSNNLRKLSSAAAQDLSTGSYYYDMKSLLTADGVLLCGRDASLRNINTYLLNPDGGIIWNKNGFPSPFYPSSTYPFILIKDFLSGSILGESFTNSGSKNDSYVHNALGQGVSWSTKIEHTDNTSICGITKANNQYVVFSVDTKLGRSFIDVLDASGKIVSQKELTLSIKENNVFLYQSKILVSDNKFVLTVLNDNKTNVYWLDQNFSIEKTITIDAKVVQDIYKTSFGYILFGDTFQVARLDNQGNLLSLGFDDYASTLNDVIQDSNGNYVLIGTSSRGNNNNEVTSKMKVLRISPDGKVVQ